MTATAASATECAKCHEPLVVAVDADSDEDVDMDQQQQQQHNPATVPDDVHLPCGDHVHWECLLDAYEVTRCPACEGDISSGGESSSSSSSQAATAPHIIVDLRNEGGQQLGIDIFPLLQEEAYLRTYPDERKARAFLEFCREGDHKAIIELLKTCGDGEEEEEEDAEMADEEEHGEKSAEEILRYQDPLAEMQSGLHCAAANGHREVAWLLLLLASELSELEFPALVYQEASALGVMREDQTGLVDIRGLKDARGRTAEDVARSEGGVVWKGWIGKGRLALP